MPKKTVKLYDLIDISDSQEVFSEMQHIIALMTDGFDYNRFEMVFADTARLFRGEYPGYQASKTKYHDLEHTHSVVLATARLMHGCFTEGELLTSRTLFLGLTAALFHDVGLIQTANDMNGTGAKYTIGHEERSIEFMKAYFASKDFSSQDAKDCAHLIQSTILSLPVKEIPFGSKEIETLGQIVGSADLLAQIADRNYLEKLLLLFKEFEEADIPGFDSELELLQKTEDFFTHVAQKRLAEDLGGVSGAMLSHFKNRWDINKDLYAESISKNIEYLKSVVTECEDSFQCYLDNLRRMDISAKVKP
jgi:hypothetical protein